jgi:hypothetical protein
LGTEDFPQVALAILSLLAVFASNLFQFFMADAPYGRLSDHVFMGLFTVAFRVFVILEMDMLRAKSSIPNLWVAFFGTTLLSFYATVDSVASYDRRLFVLASAFPRAKISQIEIVRMILDSAYVVFSMLFLVVVAVANDGFNMRRVAFFGFAVILSNAATVVAHVWFVVLNFRMFTPVPDLLFDSVHVCLAGMTVFMLHSGRGAS